MILDTFSLILIGIFVGFLLIVLSITLLLFSQEYKKITLPKFNPQRRRFLMVGGIAMIGTALGGITLDQLIKNQPSNGSVIICDGWIIKEEELKPDVCEPTPIQ